MDKEKGKQLRSSVAEWGCVLIACIFLFILFGGSVITGESPENWIRTDITVTDVYMVRGRNSHYEVTDSQGETYWITSDNTQTGQIEIGNTYRIIYSQRFNKTIRSMINEKQTIVDYEESIIEYGPRPVWHWVLAIASLLGTVATLWVMLAKVRKYIAENKDKT